MGMGLSRPTRGNLDHRHVVARTAPDQAGHRAAAVGEGDGDPAAVGGPRYDVVVGHDPTRVVEHETGAGRARTAAPGPDHHRAGQDLACDRDGVDLPRPIGVRWQCGGVGGRLDRGGLRGGGRFTRRGVRTTGTDRARRRRPGCQPGSPESGGSADDERQQGRGDQQRGAGPGSRSGSRRRRLIGRQRLEWLDAGGRRVVGVAGTGEEGAEVSGVTELSWLFSRLVSWPVGRSAGTVLVCHRSSGSCLRRGGASENRESGPTPPGRDPW